LRTACREMTTERRVSRAFGPEVASAAPLRATTGNGQTEGAVNRGTVLAVTAPA